MATIVDECCSASPLHHMTSSLPSLVITDDNTVFLLLPAMLLLLSLLKVDRDDDGELSD